MIWTTGAGPPLVLCHGGAGWVDYLGPVAAMIDDLATVHRYDQRQVGPHTVARHVADLEWLREDLGHERWAVGGHSWGASLSLSYALAHPQRVTGLLYLSGTGLGRGWRDAHNREQRRRLGPHDRARYAELDHATRTPAEDREFRILYAMTDFADRGRARQLATRFVDALPPPNYEANRSLNAELRTWDEQKLVARCRDLHTPVLVVHGVEDPRPVWAVQSLLEALPDAEAVFLPKAGHVPWLEEPGALREALRAGLPRLLGRPAGRPAGGRSSGAGCGGCTR